MSAPVEVRRVDRGGHVEWAVVHVPSGLICIGCCDTQAQAKNVLGRVQALAIDWSSFDRAAVSDPDWTKRRWPLSEAARELLVAEYRRVLGVPVDGAHGSGGESEQQLDLFEACAPRPRVVAVTTTKERL